MVADEGVLVDRLPVASNEQVLPKRREGVCQELIDSLCRDVEQGERCTLLCEQVCSEEAPSGPSTQNYSEIYVYV